MSRHIPPAAYKGGPPSQAGVVERQRALAKRRKDALNTVAELADNQQDVATELRTDLVLLTDKGHALDEIERDAADATFITSLVRRFTRRRTMLTRKSATEELLRQYEKVSVRLRRASAFSDELRLCALELQQDVQQLSVEYTNARDNAQLAAKRILDIETALDQAKSGNSSDDDLGAVLDTLAFELRQATVNLQLFQAAAEVCRENVGPARELRDTVMSLHAELSEFVTRASGTVNQSGRRIQALGMAADAPAVVAELQESLAELQDAMEVTTEYVENTRRLVGTVLPQLTAQLEAHKEVNAIDGLYKVDDITRERAHAAAERALREAAEAEVEASLRGDDHKPGKTL